MSWWGKVLGGTFGFVIGGGPLGALIGAAIGGVFDKGMEQMEAEEGAGGSAGSDDQERIQLAFFTATFSVMGHVAKADGHVSKDEIRHAEAVMNHMQLPPDMRKAAINLFNEGKKSDFDLNGVLTQFRQEAGRRTNLYRMFLEIQIQAAYADGSMDHRERTVLLSVSKQLGFPEFVFRQLEALVRAGMGAGGGAYQGRSRSGYSGGHQETGRRSAEMTLAEAYEVLGVTADSSAQEVKRAYRRLISQHHPDKLVAKGLPEEMIRLANEKSAKISGAYDLIKDARGF
ncbi:co-chaperone DjlA [Granulosicoccaceae sp. 1_MG-2023]|nr:co-chaperone DjlA [Granulosicoccaceae sp. 1_MG-2023]